MEKFIISLLLCISILFSFSQNSPNVKLKTAVQTEQSLIKTANKTNLLYSGQIVYKSSKGSYFIVKQSKKTGNWYKVYVQVS